jgi:biotin-dependent carboxylase-like uncharacterized protein
MSGQVRVLTAGLSTTVQDLGRPGRYAIGMPPSGAMDLYSCRVANLLVGNDERDAVLEATYVGPGLEFTDDRTVAVTGGEAEVTLNGEAVPTWQTLEVNAGDVLGFGFIRSGARPYVAISGGVATDPYLGSRSTYTLIGLGGLEGRKLADGDALPLGDSGGSPDAGTRVPDDLVPDLAAAREVRMVVGLCSYRLNEESLAAFLSTDWQVTKDADRVGYRLRGASLDFVERTQPFGAGSDPANVVDLGYPLGSIQVPGGDEPIVLLGDAVTGGGYATIGTVVSVDRDVFGQTKTGDSVRFRDVTIEEALEARAAGRRRLERVRTALQS